MTPGQRAVVLEDYDSDDQELQDDDRFHLNYRPSFWERLLYLLKKTGQGIKAFPKGLCYIRDDDNAHEWV